MILTFATLLMSLDCGGCCSLPLIPSRGSTVLGVIPFAYLFLSRAACVVCCAPLSELLEDPARMRSRTASSFFPLLSTPTSGVIRFGTFRGLTDGYSSGLGFWGPEKGSTLYTRWNILFFIGGRACMTVGGGVFSRTRLGYGMERGI